MNAKVFFALLVLSSASHGTQEPKHVRIWTQYIEVPHPTLTGWLNDGKRPGHVLHAEAVKLAKQGGAKILETNMVISRTGQKATIESIREEIFPTETSGPDFSYSVGNDPEVSAGIAFPVGPYPEQRGFTAFETRNTGVTLEVEPTIGDNPALVDLRVVPEIVTPLRLETMMEHFDQWGDASLRMPVYETWRCNTSISLVSGKFELASVITPKGKAPAPLMPKRVLLFVRADLMDNPCRKP